MAFLPLLAHFAGGALLMNAVPHVVSGALGRQFPTPFAKPPGEGLSSAMVNMLWGLGNLAAAYAFICRVGAFDIRESADGIALGLGVALLGIFLARHFGALNGGAGSGAK